MCFEYILKCADRKFYTGCTSNLEDRMKRHNGGQVPATKNRLPVTLMTYIVFSEKQKLMISKNILKRDQGVL